MDDIDFTKWIEIFDKALTSRDPAVKEQLSKLLMIAALSTSESPATDLGPFATMMKEINSIRYELNAVRLKVVSLEDKGYRDNSYEYYDKYRSMLKDDMIHKMSFTSPIDPEKKTALETWQDVIRKDLIYKIKK